MSSQSSSSGGIGFFGLLQILFIGLKLVHVIDWSWPWVFSPAIFSVGFILLMFIGLLCFVAYHRA